jgi:hypothetical protein
MLQLSKLLTCLYDCFYVALKYQNISYALEAVTSAIGFSIEANIKARTWVLCGQSDIDYYYPALNRGIEANWETISFNELHDKLNARAFPLVIETDPTLVPYYHPGSLEIGMPHAFLILDWEKSTNQALIYDRLAIDKSNHQTIQRDKRNFFNINLEKLYPALEKKLFISNLKFNSVENNWQDEITTLLRQSVINMEKKVLRAQLAYQAFGFEAISVFSDTLNQFNENYYDDIQSIWLMSHHLPLGIFQSVYGNRFLFKKILSEANLNNQYSAIILAIKDALSAWESLRKACIICANRQAHYSSLSDILNIILVKEKLIVEKIKLSLRGVFL